MSHLEYYDLYYKCQNYAPYHLFLFDIKNSKDIMIDKNNNYISDIALLIETVYRKIEELEKIQNRQILHRSNIISRSELKECEKNIFYFKYQNRPDTNDPFQNLGDIIGLTIIRDTLTVDEVYMIFDETKKELNITYDFHYLNCFYETDDYKERNTKLFRGYAIQILANSHKNKKNKQKKK